MCRTRKMSTNSSSASGIMSAPAKSAKRVSKKTDDVAAPAAAPVAVAAPAKEVKAKAPKAAKAEAAPAPVAAPAAPVAPVADAAAAPAAEEVRLEAEVKEVTSRLLAVRETLSALITESKKLEKRAAKLQKVADKRRRRVKTEGEEANKRPSIFQIPVALSPELCKFMGRAAGSQESRSNVTKFVTNYVREKGLKGKRHEINADAALRSLLGLKEGDQLTYFNLQTHLNSHYPKSAAKIAATA